MIMLLSFLNNFQCVCFISCFLIYSSVCLFITNIIVTITMNINFIIIINIYITNSSSSRLSSLLWLSLLLCHNFYDSFYCHMSSPILSYSCFHFQHQVEVFQLFFFIFPITSYFRRHSIFELCPVNSALSCMLFVPRRYSYTLNRVNSTGITPFFTYFRIYGPFPFSIS